MVKNSKRIKEYLNFVKFQKEVGLIIANNEKELKEIEKELDSSSFIKNNNILELGDNLRSSGKNYFNIESETRKNVYDFLIQYPTGQIDIFDNKLMKSEVIAPSYTKSTVVFLVTKKYLSKIKEEGYDLLSHVGLTYQS